MEIKTCSANGWRPIIPRPRWPRVMSLVRQMRGGVDYDSQWGKRMKGEGPIADLMAQRFRPPRSGLG
jgi:DNA repair photolyase